MHGQKSCKHRFEKRIPYLGGYGYYLKCRCGKVKKAWGLYDTRLPGGQAPTRKDDDRDQQHPEA